jgi:pimeloyl-ACP methyl ester carboxylesterase
VLSRWLLPLSLLIVACLVHADGPADNVPDKVRQIPPPGVKLADADRKDLEGELVDLRKEIENLRTALKGKPALLDLLPDVQIFYEAVRSAVTYDQFYNKDVAKDLAGARKLIKQGMERAKQLRDGKAPWNTETGLVVRGYLSKIDGSVQPYGLVVPASYSPNYPHKYRLDVWCHGRGETLSEANFLHDRQASPGQFTPPNAFVLHPYARYCNANKFAGEIDLFEALENVQKHYPIDENRLVIRGFSMGGAACWQFAVHYPSVWVAAAPGAGFSETPDFLKVFQKESVQPTDYEKTLWHMYDCTDYALNLFNCPTVAYSGEKDSQKQAADMMEKALEKEGIRLVHIIGAGAGHQYTADAKVEINRRIDSIVESGRDPVPSDVRFTTWTLRYNRSFWVTLDGLDQHWERARVDAELSGAEEGGPKLTTKNVQALTLSMPPGRCPFDIRKKVKIEIDEQELEAPKPLSDRSWAVHFRKENEQWKVVTSADVGTLRKRHGLQGPIDDAFMSSFLMVRPTGQVQNEKVGKWASAEMQHALEHWRRQFRGEARVKDDKDVSEADIAEHNLILWGDPSSNQVLAKISDKLPIKWTRENVQVGGKKFEAGHHAPVLIYPNPLNPKRYVVVNSGFTYREYEYLNNARQVPKLPDYAVVDVDVPVSSRTPGGIVTAGFFGERWDMPAQ